MSPDDPIAFQKPFSWTLEAFGDSVNHNGSWAYSLCNSRHQQSIRKTASPFLGRCPWSPEHLSLLHKLRWRTSPKCLSNIFSQLVGCLFNLLTVSFAERNSLKKFVVYFISCFTHWASAGVTRKLSPCTEHFWEFTVLHLILKSMVHFELTLFRVKSLLQI